MTLDPDDIEAIARRTVELLAETNTVNPGQLVDAATLGKHIGLSAERVRRKGHQLGGERIGDGPNARWRFDLATALQRHQQPAPQPQRPRHKPRRNTGPLLPIRP